MPEPQFFTFSDEDIKSYEEECEEKKIQNILNSNISYILGNHEPEHFEIISKYINENNKINWVNISKYEILDEQFIHNYSKKLYWEHIVRYQTLSRVSIKINRDIISKYKLWKELIKYQKLHKRIIDSLYENKKYWGKLIKYQKLDNARINNMLRVVRVNYPEQLEYYNNNAIQNK